MQYDAINNIKKSRTKPHTLYYVRFKVLNKTLRSINKSMFMLCEFCQCKTINVSKMFIVDAEVLVLKMSW